MKNSFLSVVAAASLIFGAGSALSSSGVAELSAVQGKVLVNQGRGFEAVAGVVMLNAGDTVMVGEKGSAQISYLLSNCKVTASSASVVTISDMAPCKTGEVAGMVDSVFVQPANGEAIGADVADESGDTAVPVLIGGAVIVGLGVGAYFLFFDDNSVSAP